METPNPLPPLFYEGNINAYGVSIETQYLIIYIVLIIVLAAAALIALRVIIKEITDTQYPAQRCFVATLRFLYQASIKISRYFVKYPRRVLISAGFFIIAFFCFFPPMRDARYSGQVIDFPALFMRIVGVVAITGAAFALVPRSIDLECQPSFDSKEEMP